ncbi:MAG TPA: winged helix DNA-binding domain-containing protein [Candidatus Dormibacteraeota bacterium]|nr:winged helix DNA-binding domain-containing protein [Candidatus Dormibacteraeota bacterium]
MKQTAAAMVTWPQVHAFRLQRHHLHKRAPKKDLARVVGDIGGVQAQVMSAAELQIAIRVDCTVDDVRDALWKSRSLVKTWLMRGTLHLASSDDLPLYIGAMSALWKSQMRQSWLNYMQTTEAEFWRIVDDVAAALDGRPVTREELIAVVGEGKSDHIRQMLRSGWGGMLKPAARKGLLCFGPNRGQSVTFVRPDRWLRSWRSVDADAALAAMARRYLSAYGPATKSDFARWWGAWPGVGKAAWSALNDEVTTVSVEGAKLEMLAKDVSELNKARLEDRVQLIPGFDPYVLGHASRDHLFEKRFASRVSRTAGWISACVLFDGEVLGTWSHKLKNRKVEISVTPFRRLAPAVRAGVKDRAAVIADALRAQKVEVSFL